MITNMEKSVLTVSVVLAMSAQAQAWEQVDYQSHSYTNLQPKHAQAFGYGSQVSASLDSLDKAYIGRNDDIGQLIAQDRAASASFTTNKPYYALSDGIVVEDAGNVSGASITLDEAPVLAATRTGKISLVAESADTAEIVSSGVQAAEDEIVSDIDSGIDATATGVDDAAQSTARAADASVDATMDAAASTVDDALYQPDPVAEAIDSQDAAALEATSQAAAQEMAQAPVAVAKETPQVEVPTPSMVAQKPATADAALAQQEGDATSEKSLEEVFTASEKRYSLLKQGDWGLNYDATYSYYRDSRIDIATGQGTSNILRFRVEEDAQHTLINSFNVQYGLRDNLTLSADVPIVAKTDLVKDSQTVGIGDVTLGARWEPFPLEKDRLPLIFNGNISLPTGDSPYEINRSKDLSTGKGYYSVGGGVSTRKYVDPVVLFASGSLSYGLERDDLEQDLGGRTLVGVKPNLGGGVALGFAYSLNYDVSLTMSYQQSFSVGSEFTVRELEDKNNEGSRIVERTSSSADQTSATLNMALGVRVSPKTIVNTSVGIGLTEDAPDVSLGVSFPLDFAGLGNRN